MSKNNKKSPKDMAFEKERAKYRQEIRGLEFEIRNLNLKNIELAGQIKVKELQIQNKDNQIEYLRNQMSLSEEELKSLLNRMEVENKLQELFGSLGIIDAYRHIREIGNL